MTPAAPRPVVSIGEPMAEFAALERGRLGDVEAYRRGWGGDTANFIVAAARLGLAAAYVTRVGSDEFGRSFLALWEREGVHTAGVNVEPGAFTAVYFISRRPEGGHDFTYYRAGSAASRLAPSDVDPARIRGARLVHLSGISQAVSPSCREATRAALAIARDAGVPVSYDANVRPRLLDPAAFRPIFEETARRADIVFLSAEDAGHLYGAEPPARVVDRILELGADCCVLKLGAGGCLAATKAGERVASPAFEIEVVDTTGAGDAFDAGYVAAWLEGRATGEAARFANAVGALTSSGLGAVAPSPTRSAVEEFLRRALAGRTPKGVIDSERQP